MQKQPRPKVAEQPTPANRPWLTTADMLRIMGITRLTLRQLIAAGDIRASRVGNSPASPYRFHPDEPDRYFTANAVQRAS